MDSTMLTNIKRTAIRLIARAANPSTSPSDAIGALSLLHRQLNQQGLSIDEILVESPPLKLPATPPPVIDKSEIENLKKEISEKDKIIEKYKSLIPELEKQIKTEREKRIAPPPVLKNDENREARNEPYEQDYSYDAFQEAAIKRFNKVHGWQTIFSHYSGINRAMIQAWRQKGRVSDDAYEKLYAISSIHSPTKKTAWTDSELARCLELCKEGTKTDTDIANILTNEFGRRITPNSIAGTKSRLRTQGKL